uniref:Uncharacterized protein n=1 Tax=Plectus sambesii TaxID=2011161 RepID=A0A914VRF6_9BILA
MPISAHGPQLIVNAGKLHDLRYHA